MISIHLFVYFVSCGDRWKIERDGGGGEREGKG